MITMTTTASQTRKLTNLRSRGWSLIVSAAIHILKMFVLGSVDISLCDSVSQKAANRKKGLRRCSGSTSSKPDEASGSFLGHPKGASEASQLVVAAVRNTASIPSLLRLDLKSLAGTECKNLCQQNLMVILTMIRVIIKNTPGSVQLFCHHDPDHGMGQGQRRK